jgi:DnaJ like chaperone protein
MSIWGALLGGVTGIVLGGPLGALIGAALGHVAVDRPLTARARLKDPERRQALFSVAVIALAAKMASADGSADAREKQAFDRLFHVAPEEHENVDRFWRLAQATPAGFESYARQIAGLFGDTPAILEDVVGALCAIALADGHAADAELDFVERVMEIFQLPPPARARLQARLTGDPAHDPWAVLGLAHDASEADIRTAYRRLVKQHHPDATGLKGLPSEFRAVSDARMAALNGAYEKLVRRQVAV